MILVRSRGRKNQNANVGSSVFEYQMLRRFRFLVKRKKQNKNDQREVIVLSKSKRVKEHRKKLNCPELHGM